MIWHPGSYNPHGPQYLKQILVVDYTAANHGNKIVLIAADSSGDPTVGVFDSVWIFSYHPDLSVAEDWRARPAPQVSRAK